MQPVKLGIIGCGVIGPTHARGAAESDLIDLVAVADLIVERAQAVAERHHVARVYGSGEELLKDPDVDAVVLALPAHARTDLALQAFARGKHVLTEKPAAMNAAEVERMIAARGDRVAACCSSRYHFYPSTRAAVELVASGVLGDLRTVHFRAVRAAGPPPASPPPEWRLKKHLNGGGILMNWSCYDLDYLLGIVGWSLQPRRALAQTWTVPPRFQDRATPGSDAETHFIALIRCEGGVMLSCERAEFAAGSAQDVWQIVGTDGSLRLQMLPGEGKQIIHQEAVADQGVVDHVIWEGDESWQVAHSSPVQDFAVALHEGREPQTTLERALVVQKISDAIYASAEQGTAIDIG